MTRSRLRQDDRYHQPSGDNRKLGNTIITSFNFISRIPLRPAQNLPIDVAHFNVCEVSVGNARDQFGLGTGEYGVQGTDQQAAGTRQTQVPGTYIRRVKSNPLAWADI
jgi:hypothetical protein